jgi:hypothetical protein
VNLEPSPGASLSPHLPEVLRRTRRGGRSRSGGDLCAPLHETDVADERPMDKGSGPCFERIKGFAIFSSMNVEKSGSGIGTLDLEASKRGRHDYRLS